MKREGHHAHDARMDGQRTGRGGRRSGDQPQRRRQHMDRRPAAHHATPRNDPRLAHKRRKAPEHTVSAVGSGALSCQCLAAYALRVLAPMTTPTVRATALIVVAAGSAHVQPHTGPRVCTDGHGTGRWGVAAGGDAAAAVVGDDLTGAIWMKGDQAATVPREVGDHKRLVVSSRTFSCLIHGRRQA